MHDVMRAFREAILATLGHAPDLIEPGRFYRFATSDRRVDDAGWCKLFDDLRGGVFGCHRQGVSESWSSARPTTLNRQLRAELAKQVLVARAARETQQRRQWAQNAQLIAQMWSQCVPLEPGDPVTLYLQRRGAGGVRPLPEVLMLHRALPYWHGTEKRGKFPVMIAPIVAPDGGAVALHRTYLTVDGHKADVPSPKKLTGAAGPLVGACIPLHKPVHGCIGIAEGIETALAAWCASGVPTVAGYCARNLAAWRWPLGVHRLVIFADNDKAGCEAAGALQLRALRAGISSNVIAPTDAGADWADVWADRAPGGGAT
jgi:phage/plasmid primase-like uncharacterized protein